MVVFLLANGLWFIAYRPYAMNHKLFAFDCKYCLIPQHEKFIPREVLIVENIREHGL